MTADDEFVRLAFDEGVAVLTLNRPGSLNAMSAHMMHALERRLDALADLPDLRVVLITGAGRAFCAGGDLIEFEAALRRGKRELLAMLDYNSGVLTRVAQLPVPVIGVANGTAVAGGLELLLCCDIILAAEGARIGDGHARYGVVPAGGATVRLPRRIGSARAALLFSTADLFDAATLRDWGLVDEIVPSDRLMLRAKELARTICRASPEVLRRIKRLTAPDDAAGLRAEIEAFEAHLDGSDLAEGLAAFREKRQPQYRSFQPGERGRDSDAGRPPQSRP